MEYERATFQDAARQNPRKHVFAVDQDPDFLDVARVLLQDETYHVTTTNYVPRTWNQIAAMQPSLLLIDLSPVRPDAALELLEHLHREGITNTIPVIITSTDPRLLERIKQDTARLGGDGFVVKPLDIDVLLKTIHELIGGA